MKGEQLKSILLTLLVVSSLLLTLANWNYQPHFEMTGSEEDLVDAQVESGSRLSKVEILKPIYMILHHEDFDKPIGMKDKGLEQEVFTSMLDYSLYNFATFNLDEEWWDGLENRVEVVFPTALPSETIYDLFNIDHDTSIQPGVYNRIEIILDHAEEYHIVFRNDQDNRVIGASLQNYDRVASRLEGFFKQNDYITYEVLQSSRGTNMYIPNDVDPNVLLFSYADIPVDPFHNFLFSTPSIVRSARSMDGNTIFIDGTREMILESDRISFTNQTNQAMVSDDELSYYELLDQVQTFVNNHNGFTFKSPFSYFLSHLEKTPETNQVIFTLSYNGIPIFADQDIANISVAWHNQEIYQYSHPLVMLVERRGIGRQSADLPNVEDVIKSLNSEYYRRSAIYDVAIGYRVREQVSGQGQVYELIPTWFVKGINGWHSLVTPIDSTGGDSSAMESN